MQTQLQKTKLLTITALFAALIYLVTAYLHIPSHTGYTHVGDAFIYLAGSLLPTPYAAAAGAIGAALADGLTGYAMWMLPSVIIKALTVLFFTAAVPKIICKRNLLALVPSFLLCAGGYYLAEGLMTGNFIAPLAGIPGYVTQVGLSAALYLGLGFALDRLGFKKQVLKTTQGY